jgi:hypothetical protein
MPHLVVGPRDDVQALLEVTRVVDDDLDELDVLPELPLGPNVEQALGPPRMAAELRSRRTRPAHVPDQALPTCPRNMSCRSPSSAAKAFTLGSTVACPHQLLAHAWRVLDPCARNR